MQVLLKETGHLGTYQLNMIKTISSCKGRQLFDQISYDPIVKGVLLAHFEPRVSSRYLTCYL